jgi:hypothetical protein
MTAIGVLKSFPDHKGIPGHQGGSLPRGYDFTSLAGMEDFIKNSSPKTNHVDWPRNIELHSPRLEEVNQTSTRGAASGSNIFLDNKVSNGLEQLMKDGKLDDNTANSLTTLAHEYYHTESPHIGVLSKPGESYIEEGLVEHFARKAVESIYPGIEALRDARNYEVQSLRHTFSDNELVKLFNMNDEQRTSLVRSTMRSLVATIVINAGGSEALAKAVAHDVKDPMSLFKRPYKDMESLKTASKTSPLYRVLQSIGVMGGGLRTIDWHHYRPTTGVLKSFPNHKGRPGQHGGSAKRGEGTSTVITIPIKDLSSCKDYTELAQWWRNNYPNIGFVFDKADFYAAKRIVKQFDVLAHTYPKVASNIIALKCADLGEHIYGREDNYGMDHALRFNLQWFKKERITFLESNVISDSLNGWHPIGCDDIESLLTHEFGHAVRAQYYKESYNFESSNAPHTIQDIVSDAFYPSQYAKQNKAEMFAESFASLYHTPANIQVLYVKKLENMLSLIDK